MTEQALIARWFLLGGGALAILGLILWLTLPLPLSFPPFLVTALLAVAYGLFCLERARQRSAPVRKRNVMRTGKKTGA